MISGVASTYPTPEIRTAAANAAALAAFAATNETNAVTNASAAAAAFAALNATRAVTNAASAANKTFDAARGTTEPFNVDGMEAIYTDAGLAPASMLSTSLWHEAGWPEGLSPDDIGPTLLDTDPRFDFFKRWYEGMVRGAPLDWELQRRVALIPQEVWEAGADAVAGAIAEIEARLEVQKAAAALLADREAALVQNRLGIGGNSPPEPIEVPAEVVASQTIIWAAVEEIAEEAEAETPDKARVARALEALAQGLGVCIKWLGRKADLVVDTAIKWSIPAAGTALIVANPAKVQTLIQTVQTWLSLLP